jgi:hypothetical protein
LLGSSFNHEDGSSMLLRNAGKFYRIIRRHIAEERQLKVPFRENLQSTETEALRPL